MTNYLSIRPAGLDLEQAVFWSCARNVGTIRLPLEPQQSASFYSSEVAAHRAEPPFWLSIRSTSAME